MTSCWIVTEGIAGTENQCIGVAEALNIEPSIKRITLHQPWKTLSPFLRLEQSWIFTPRLEVPWPDILLASGRKSIAAARYIKKASNNKTFVVQIQDPRISPRHFDLVAVPMHDPTRGKNVITTTAAPNRITPDRLAKAKEAFKGELSMIQQPRIAVLIGGNSKAHKMSSDTMRELCADLKKQSENGAGLMITASRRTGKENIAILREQLKDTDAYIWDGSEASDKPNPYFGLLAWADHILVTEDSVSMISEAATTGKPVYMIPLEGDTKRFKRFHEGLIDKGIIRIFKGKLEDWAYEPLNDACTIADEIRNHMKI